VFAEFSFNVPVNLSAFANERVSEKKKRKKRTTAWWWRWPEEEKVFF